jgi:8-oxo-dGTP diphosphatase
MIDQRLRPSAYALVVDEGRILLCRLSGEVRGTGAWTLPGGGLDFGEAPEAAAVREVIEETGLTVSLGRLETVRSRVYDHGNYQLQVLQFVYRARVLSGEITHEASGSTDQCGWFTLEEARKMTLVDLAQEGLRIAFSGGECKGD